MGGRQLLRRASQLAHKSLNPSSSSSYLSRHLASSYSSDKHHPRPKPVDSTFSVHARSLLGHNGDEEEEEGKSNKFSPSSVRLSHLVSQAEIQQPTNSFRIRKASLLNGQCFNAQSKCVFKVSDASFGVRFCSTVATSASASTSASDNRLEDELGIMNGKNSSETVTAGGNSEGFVDTETVTGLVTPQAQAISEVSAVIGDCSYPTAFLQLLIEGVHLHAGLPWWAAIAATTLAIRIFCVPVVVFQLRSAAKLSLMRPEMERINAEIKDSGYDPRVSAEARERIMALFTKYNTTPFSPFVGALLQAPIFMCFFFAIRNMAARVESFKGGGFLWFTDLTTPDTTYILPLATCLGVLLTVELNAAEGMEGNPLADKMKKFMRIFAIVLFPISMNFEKALFFYWMTSNFWSLVQSTVMKRPSVKSFLQIPETSHLGKPESSTRPEPAVVTAPVLKSNTEPVLKSVARPIKPIARKKTKGSKRK